MAKKSISQKELEFLFPETEVEVGGCTFTLRPFNFKETFIVADKLQDVMDILVVGADATTPRLIAKIFAHSYEGVRDVIALSLKIKPEQVDEFDSAEAVKVIAQIIAINKDFFVSRVKSEMDTISAQIQPQTPPEK